MILDLKTVEAVLRQHWKVPVTIDQEKMSNQAFKIQVMVGQKYAHQNLKYQLGLIQTKDLKLETDEKACDDIATELLRIAKA